jgi:hypothetical protein
VLAAQLGVERRDEARVGGQHPAPGCELAIGQALCG